MHYFLESLAPVFVRTTACILMDSLPDDELKRRKFLIKYIKALPIGLDDKDYKEVEPRIRGIGIECLHTKDCGFLRTEFLEILKGLGEK